MHLRLSCTTPLGWAGAETAAEGRRMAMRRWVALMVGALVVASAGHASADDGWQDEVHLRPESVDALLSVQAVEPPASGGTVDRGGEIDTGEFTTVTVTHGEGGGCQTPGATRVTMTGTRSDGTSETLVSQCEVSSVGGGEARGQAEEVARDTAKLRLPTAGFDPKVRGLVGLRTWLHVAVPDQRVVSAAIRGYDLRAVATPIAVEVVLDGEPQAVRLSPAPGTPPDAVGPFVFRRSGRHHLTVRVMWMAEWALIDPTGNAVRFGNISSVPGPTVSTDYTVVQAQARLR